MRTVKFPAFIVTPLIKLFPNGRLHSLHFVSQHDTYSWCCETFLVLAFIVGVRRRVPPPICAVRPVLLLVFRRCRSVVVPPRVTSKYEWRDWGSGSEDRLLQKIHLLRLIFTKISRSNPIGTRYARLWSKRWVKHACFLRFGSPACRAQMCPMLRQIISLAGFLNLFTSLIGHGLLEDLMQQSRTIVTCAKAEVNTGKATLLLSECFYWGNCWLEWSDFTAAPVMRHNSYFNIINPHFVRALYFKSGFFYTHSELELTCSSWSWAATLFQKIELESNI